MFINIIKTTIRGFFRRRISLLNIFGLSIGLACFILAYLFMSYKLSYDRSYEHSERIVRVLEKLPPESGDLVIALNPSCLGNELKAKFPEVEKATTINLGWQATLSYENKIFQNDRCVFADEDFLDVFKLKLKAPSLSKGLLSDPYSILMSETIAQKYFGDEDPMGKIVTANDSISLKVVGIYEDVVNSHLDLDMIIPLSFFNAERGMNLVNNWGNYDYIVYLLMTENADRENLQIKINEQFKDQPPSDNFPEVVLQPLEDVFLYSSHIAYDWVKDSSGGISIVYIVVFTALAILILACINFMNLITAQSDSRAKEIGVRKVFGSSSGKLITQLLGENVFQTLAAFFLAMVIAEIAHPYFNQIMNADVIISYFDIKLMITLLSFAVIIGVFAGLYPSIFLSRVRPLKALQLEKANKAKGGLLRKMLVVLQFFVASVLIVSVIFISQQVYFLLNKDLGYNKDNLLHLYIGGNSESSYEAFKAKLLQSPDIKMITGTLNLPNWSGPSGTTTEWEGNEMDNSLMLYNASVDYDYFETFEMEMASGRSFSKEYSMDKTDAVIVNEAAVAAMGMKNPIGKYFSLAGDSDWGMKGKIIGVVKNFNFENAKAKIQPLAIQLNPSNTKFIVLRVNSNRNEVIEKYIETCWNEFYPTKNLRIRYLSATIDQLYDAEKSTKKIIALLTIIAIIISCFGLLGLVLFTLQKRTKEIGIRKILGANSMGVVRMLSKEYALLILTANVLAAPISYYYVMNTLSAYEYHIDINVWPFIASFLISLLFAMLTLIFRTHKAANLNPVDAISYE